LKFKEVNKPKLRVFLLIKINSQHSGSVAFPQIHISAPNACSHTSHSIALGGHESVLAGHRKGERATYFDSVHALETQAEKSHNETPLPHVLGSIYVAGKCLLECSIISILSHSSLI
jgi:hypothetical protein